MQIDIAELTKNFSGPGPAHYSTPSLIDTPLIGTFLNFGGTYYYLKAGNAP